MGWDKGLDLEAVVRRLREHKCRTSRCKAYKLILLIQAFNGLRISEAVECSLKFLKDKDTQVYVRVAKKRKPEYRLCLIPDVVKRERDTLAVIALENPETVVKRIKSWALMVLGINTHSIRYAWINYLLKTGVDPVSISKTLKHSRIDILLDYARAIKYEDMLKRLFK